MKGGIAFILYDSRSGSTMLADQLERFGQVFVSNETAFISRLFSLPSLLGSNELTAYLLEEPQFRDLGLSADEVRSIVEEHKDVKGISETVLLTHLGKRYAWFEDNDDVCIVVKHPPTNHLRLFEQTWPDAKAMFLVRDGRDIHVSKANSINLKGKAFSSNVLQSAVNWQYKVRVFQQTTWKLLVIRYEDLLQNQTLLSDAVSWLGVAPVLSDRPEKRFPVPDGHRHFHSNVGGRVITKNFGKYPVGGYVNFVYSLMCRKELESLGYNNLIPQLGRVNPLNYIRLMMDFSLFLVLAITRIIRMSAFDRHRVRMRIHKLKIRLYA